MKRGFTLIELLVVIAIIGVLSSVVMASLNTARIKARDTSRISQLAQIRSALELYYLDHGSYPSTDCAPPPGSLTGYNCNGYRYSNVPSSWAILAGQLAPYIAQLPVDPVNNGCSPWGANCLSYTYGNVGSDPNTPQYDLTAQLEDPNSPYRCGVRNYKLYFTGNQRWCTAFGGSYSNQIYEASPL